MASWQASPFAGAQIDFSQLGKIPDAYYDAQNDALKRENMRQTMAHQQQVRGQANADRDALKSIAAEGFPRDAQGNPDYRAAAERVFQATGNIDAANKVAQMGKGWTADPTPLMRNLEAAGLQRGSPEYRKALMDSLNKGEGGAPSNVREWEYFNKLSPEQQQQYLVVKRAEKYLDRGTDFARPNPIAPGEVMGTIQKDVAGAEAEKVRGKTQAEGEAALPKVANALAEYELKNKNVLEDIDRAASQASAWTTGFIGGKTSSIEGTPAHDLQKTLIGIQSNLGFETLQQMRDNSPTGGALGNVTERELELLQSTWGSLAQSQTEGQFRHNLARLKQIKQQYAVLKRQAYEADVRRFGRGAVPNPETGQMGASGATVRTQPQSGSIPPAAVRDLVSDPSPEAIREFDEVFGPGSANRFLQAR